MGKDEFLSSGPTNPTFSAFCQFFAKIWRCAEILKSPSDPKLKTWCPFQATSPALHTQHSVHPFVFHSEIGSSQFRHSLEIGKLHRQECTHHWQFCRFFPSPTPSGPKFDRKVFTAAPLSEFIFTHSNRFGLFTPPRSKLPKPNELSFLYELLTILEPLDFLWTVHLLFYVLSFVSTL